ncbi:hypothetical protein GCM10010520_66550 [Rhizobium viscosum]
MELAGIFIICALLFCGLLFCGLLFCGLVSFAAVSLLASPHDLKRPALYDSAKILTSRAIP